MLAVLLYLQPVQLPVWPVVPFAEQPTGSLAELSVVQLAVHDLHFVLYLLLPIVQY